MSPGADPLPRAAPEALGFSAARLARIGPALQAEIASGRLPGAVVAIARKGSLAYYEPFGYLDKATGAPMPRDAIFSVASMTKPMVSVAALTLYEEGRLFVNQPVGQYLPQIANMRVAAARVDAAGDTVTDSVPAARQMTIQDLMRHTAGITYGNRGTSALYRSYPGSSDWAAENLSGSEFLEKLAALPLHFQPGSAWDYSFGFDVLGLAIEAITGQTLGRFMDERLFKPLAMADTGFVVPADMTQRYAQGLAHDPATGMPQSMRDSTKRMRFECGGGGAVSTAADYLRFAQMLLDRGALDDVRILGRKTVEYMTADHLGTEVDIRRLREYPNINGYGFGLGVAVRRQAGVSGIMSSPGEFNWAGSTGTYFWVDPAEQLAVVFMAHTPGPLRFYYRQMLHALVMQAIAD